MGVSTENAQLQKEKPGTFGDRLGVLKKEDHPKDQHLAITGLLETAPCYIHLYPLVMTNSLRTWKWPFIIYSELSHE